ncbi:hypothetical protein [Cnuibacter physcomitrellae]|uniref:hypothetical protein n=1 Tax=Cnuibacter physcomitrellae TaxID=1619308 RepID=UPI0012F48FDC|nr:hypothetical protein [Cnuibacter physcomitrellae]
MAMLGDFLFETSSAEDESRRILEILHAAAKDVLSGRDLASLKRFTSEHNRDQRKSESVEETHVSWGRIDLLSHKIIRLRAQTISRMDPEFVENLTSLDRMFATTHALRRFRNLVDHRAPSDGGAAAVLPAR